MSAKSFADKLKRDQESPDLAKIEWNADHDVYHVTIGGQPTVVATIAELEALGQEVERIMAKAAE